MPTKDRNKANKYQREWYKRNRAQHIAAVAKNRQKTVDWYNDYKSKLVCACGENHPACLEFHHREPSKKAAEVSVLVRLVSVSILKREIAKCDVVCSNCHRKLEYNLRQQKSSV